MNREHSAHALHAAHSTGAYPPDTAVAYINPAAVAHNLQCLRQKLMHGGQANTPRIWAVAKADAYGHHLTHVLAGLEQADGIAVLHLSDAYQCRSLGWRKPVLVMSAPCTAKDLRDPALFPLHLVVDSEEQLAMLEKLQEPSQAHVWLRYSGSLHQAGFNENDYTPAYRRLQQLLFAGRLAAIGHLHHYADAEDAQQLHEERHQFQNLFAKLAGARCTENSAALLSDPGYAAQTDWVRSGLALYGASPLPGINGPDLGLKPAMTLVAPVYQVLSLRAGQPLGYGGTFRTDRDLRIGLVRCGYADGYPRNVSEDCAVLIAGRKSRILGRVAMDTLTVDLSSHPDASVGTPVVLWGTDELSIETIARSAHTIAAQLCTGLTARVPRVISAAPPAWERT